MLVGMKAPPILALWLGSLITGCSSVPREAVPPPVPESAAKPVALGSDRDSHGCIPSAGYTWCEQTSQCERPWELAKEKGFENSAENFHAFCAGWSGVQADVWNCRNDVEVQCTEESCGATSEEGSFTPMSLAFSTSGSFSLCAYSGCWDAEGDVIVRSPFVVIMNKGAQWSDPSSNGERDSDILIAFDTTDRVALIKAGGFTTPFHCKLQRPEQ
jgi:hypothetical protein